VSQDPKPIKDGGAFSVDLMRPEMVWICAIGDPNQIFFAVTLLFSEQKN